MDPYRKPLLSPENELAVQLCMRMDRCGPRYERGPGPQMYQQVINTTASVLLYTMVFLFLLVSVEPSGWKCSSDSSQWLDQAFTPLRMSHQDTLRPKTKSESHEYQVQELLAQNEVPVPRYSFITLFSRLNCSLQYLSAVPALQRSQRSICR